MNGSGERMVARTSPAARAGVLVWAVFVAANVADVLARLPVQRGGRIELAALLLGCGIAWVTAVRPAVVADPSGVLLRNPLRDHWCPWRSVSDVDAIDQLLVRTADGRVHRSWAVLAGNRERRRALEGRGPVGPDDTVPSAAVQDAMRGRTYAGFVAADLRERLARHRAASPDEPPRVTWSVAAIAALAVPALLLAVAALL